MFEIGLYLVFFLLGAYASLLIFSYFIRKPIANAFKKYKDDLNAIKLRLGILDDIEDDLNAIKLRLGILDDIEDDLNASLGILDDIEDDLNAIKLRLGILDDIEETDENAIQSD